MKRKQDLVTWKNDRGEITMIIGEFTAFLWNKKKERRVKMSEDDMLCLQVLY